MKKETNDLKGFSDFMRSINGVIEIPLYYQVQEDGTRVYDWDSMQEVYNNKCIELENKEGN